jgi:hypothetical protein
MADTGSEQFVLLNRLANEFAARYRKGERPALQEYIDRHPELADDIREFFPALAQVEQVKEDRQQLREPPAAGPLPPLERLGDFRILREVGRGGMGVVCRGRGWSAGPNRRSNPRSGVPSAGRAARCSSSWTNGWRDQEACSRPTP